MGRVETQVEELPENRVRLTVEVPRDVVQHAVDHAASDLAGSVKIPGFRKGKVPLPVLVARVGKERLYSEAVESHIGGWFRNAALTSRVRPVSRPEYEYDLPSSADETFSFRATVDVQPKIEPADWTKLEVPSAEPEVPGELLEAELEAEFRAAAVDRLVEATRVQPAPALVDSRANELLSGMLRSLDRRGISIETYLAVTGQTPEQLRDGLRAEAARSVARELV